MEGTATVVKNAGSHYLLSALPVWAPFPAVLKGKIRLKGGSSTNPVAVGDRVRWSSEGDPSLQAPAVISEVLDRKNYVVRKSTNLSRTSHVILNKVDLYRDECADEIADFRRIYEGAGYPVIETSAVTGEGVETLRADMAGKVILFSGESGVGKSSLVKALDPSLDPKVGRISDVHLQGKHTTSLYEMYPLSGGGYVIDTPGLRGFGLVHLEKEEIPLYFPEMLRASRECRFTPCTHTHEPGCAVKAAVEAGTISAERYNSYLGMLEEDKKFR